ncbi:MAG: hypothetical protein JWP16_2283, partial [Alphaproteobacteria bacterium]|nr:hypothetical protein [Alphaproteobacteria bacterium]
METHGEREMIRALTYPQSKLGDALKD